MPLKRIKFNAPTLKGRIETIEGHLLPFEGVQFVVHRSIDNWKAHMYCVSDYRTGRRVTPAVRSQDQAIACLSKLISDMGIEKIHQLSLNDPDLNSIEGLGTI